MFKMFSRAASFALPLSAALVFALAPKAVAQQQNQQQQQQGQGPRSQKKKLQASSNFTQYAGRDASNRLIAGGATRGMVADEAAQLSQKGQDAYEAGKYDEAVAAFQRVTELKPTDARAFYHLGVAYETGGHYKEAVAAYRQAAALADKMQIKAISLYNMGNSYAADNQPKEAAEAYKQVIALVPDQPVAHYNLALAYAAAGQYEEAVTEFKQAVKLKADYAEAEFNLGITYGNLGRFDAAADAFKRAAQLKPDYAEAHYNLGLADLALDDKAGVQSEFKTLETLNKTLAARLKSLSQ